MLDIANVAGLTLGAYIGLKRLHRDALLAGRLAGRHGRGGRRSAFCCSDSCTGRSSAAARLIPLIASIGVFIAIEEVFRLVFGPYTARLPGEGRTAADAAVGGTLRHRRRAA